MAMLLSPIQYSHTFRGAVLVGVNSKIGFQLISNLLCMFFVTFARPIFDEFFDGWLDEDFVEVSCELGKDGQSIE